MSSDEKPDRRIKVASEEVKQEIDGAFNTAAELAEKFDVCTQTIRNKIRTLRQENEPVIHTQNGYILINREWLAVEENAKDLEAYQRWIISAFKAFRPLINPIKPLLPLMRRTLSVNMSREERHELMQACAKVTALLAFSEVEDEEDEGRIRKSA